MEKIKLNGINSHDVNGFIVNGKSDGEKKVREKRRACAE